MEFVQNFTPPNFQAKNFTLSILPNFNSFSKKKTQKMSENGEIYTAGKNFTLPPAMTALTNSNSDYIVSYWCRRMIICKTGWQPVTAGGSSMITMQCTATQNLRKEYLKSKCEEKKNSCSKITMTSNIQVLRKEMSTIFKDINTYFMEMLHNLKGLGISYLAYILHMLLFFISWSSIALFL